MAPRAHLLFKQLIASAMILIFISCTNTKKGEAKNASPLSFFVDTASIPKDTVLLPSQHLKLENGIYYFNKQPFSGYVKEQYENKQVSIVSGFLKGMQHGIATSYYPSGKIRFVRMYKENKSYGRHTGYWENGNQKFAFFYLNDKREGLNKQWYENGQPYAFLNFKDDKEDGMQQAWRENGKPYINYQAKDGFRYGLQKSSLCYTLKDEKFKN
jgi:antitoxin component YwqK of YwqJK toxin-antitoxin module